MKTNTLLALAVVAVGTLFASSAQAGGIVRVSVGVPVCRPAPICAPVVRYCPPPRPVCPPVVYVPPYRHHHHHDCDRRCGGGYHHHYGGDRDGRGHGYGHGGRR